MSFRLAIGLGAVTVISGRAVAPPPAAGAPEPCDNAEPPNAHSSSAAEHEARNVRFNENDIVPDPAKAKSAYVIDELGLQLAVDVRRTDFD
jgi:hypothetical protein